MKRSDRLVINVAEIKEDGLKVKGEIPASVFELGPDQCDRQNCPNPLLYDLHAAKVNEGILISGRASTIARCRCDRCLVYYDRELVTDDVSHYETELHDNQADFTEAVREDVLIMFGDKNLCREDCKGMCPSCGVNLNQRTCDCEEPAPDAGAWHQLDDLDL